MDNQEYKPTDLVAYSHSPAPKTFLQKVRSNLSTIILLLLAPVVALLITAFAFQSYQVDGQSMETTLQDHDRLIVNKLPRTLSRITGHPYIPHRGDIIIFNQGGIPTTNGSEEKQLIKRVIGLPGEKVVVGNGKIIIYNTSHSNGFDPDKSGLYTITAPSTPGDKSYILGPDQIFVCGDNRLNSEDSRYFGPVDVSNIVGRLSLRIFPLNKTHHF